MRPPSSATLARQRAGLTLIQAAKALWIQPSTLARLERSMHWSCYRAQRAVELYRECGAQVRLEDFLPETPTGSTRPARNGPRSVRGGRSAGAGDR